MTKLECSVTNCVHNADRCCCKSSILVDGQEVDCTWNQKCVGISFKHIRDVPDVVGVASSPLKAPAILAAIRGQLIDTLITDGTTATAVLNMLE